MVRNGGLDRVSKIITGAKVSSFWSLTSHDSEKGPQPWEIASRDVDMCHAGGRITRLVHDTGTGRRG